MLDAPHWYARKYNSVVARTRESDPDAEFHLRQIGAELHASRLATIDYGDAFVLDLQDKGGIAMSGAINGDALTAVFLWVKAPSSTASAATCRACGSSGREPNSSWICRAATA